MGRTAAILPLVARGEAKRPTNDAIREAVRANLGYAWNEMLPPAWREFAQGWIFNGSDSLVTVQDDDDLAAPAEQIEVWFYRGADWAMNLAEHWLELALAARRPDFQNSLWWLGVEVPAAKWPALGPGKTRFVEHEGSVGRVDGDTVWWEADEPGSDARRRGQSPFKSLPKAVRDRYVSGACLCPACVFLKDRIAPEIVASKGVHVEPVFGLTEVEGVYAPRAGGLLAWGSGYAGWVARRTDDSVWQTVHELDHENRFQLVHTVGAEAIAIVGHFAPKFQYGTRVSRDGGTEWSAIVPTKLPSLRNKTAFLANPNNASLVFASNGKALYRSDDGGKTFGRTLSPKLEGKPPHEIQDIFPCGGRLLAQWMRTADADFELVASDDGGKTFVPVLAAAPGVWGTSSGAVVVYAKKPQMQITTDGGRTWTKRAAPFAPSAVHFGGRWFAVAPGDGLYASDDEGASWQKLATGAFERVFADESDPESCYVATRSVAFRVVIAPVTRATPPRRQVADV